MTISDLEEHGWTRERLPAIVLWIDPITCSIATLGGALGIQTLRDQKSILPAPRAGRWRIGRLRKNAKLRKFRNGIKGAKYVTSSE